MLNVQSVWLIGALSVFAFGALVLLVRGAYSGALNRGLLYTALANLSLGLSFSLRICYGHVPDFFGQVLANTAATLSLGLVFRSIVALKRQKSCSWLSEGVPALMFAVSFWLTSVHRNLTVNQFLFNVFNLLMILAVFERLARPEEGWRPFADRIEMVVFGLLALSSVGVVISFLVSGSFPREYNFSQPRAAYNIVFSITMTGLVSSVFLLMVSERLNRELKMQALRDPLTGVYNRRAFEEIAFREISGSVRTGVPFALLVCDIDYFKSINDTYGHMVGDAALAAVAQTIRASLRSEDFLCRWGGDEFFALLPRAGLADAEVVAWRIVQVFDQWKMRNDDLEIDVNVSLGVASNESRIDDLSYLLKMADRAMYCAKHEGRRGYAVASPAQEEEIAFITV